MIIRILFYYYRTIFLKKKLNSREKIIKHQKNKFKKLIKKISKKSLFYQPYLKCAFHEWPIINKKIMMEYFDQINTKKIKKKDAFELASKAEQTRNFSQLLQGTAVGLSSGTSGSRGLFLTSPRERDAWVGTILAKVLLPNGLKTKEKMAFFLRANNPLYINLTKSKKIQFYFLDLFGDFDEHIKTLNTIQPTILSAPASVLYLLAQKRHQLTIQPKKIISVAEVLDKSDEAFISMAFNLPVAQIYQCTEGFLAYSDNKTNELIMNDEFLIIEKEWIDDTHFIPIITDLLRTSQPIIRYRLDDILVEKETDIFTKLKYIEGRLGDTLYAKKGSGTIPIFADVIRQQMASSTINFKDYKIIQYSLNELSIQIFPKLKDRNKKLLITHLNQIFIKKDCEMPNWQWQEYERRSLYIKQRRIESKLAYPPKYISRRAMDENISHW